MTTTNIEEEDLHQINDNDSHVPEERTHISSAVYNRVSQELGEEGNKEDEVDEEGASQHEIPEEETILEDLNTFLGGMGANPGLTTDQATGDGGDVAMSPTASPLKRKVLRSTRGGKRTRGKR